MNDVQYRHRSRSCESPLVDGALLLCMLAGVIIAVVVMADLGFSAEILSF